MKKRLFFGLLSFFCLNLIAQDVNYRDGISLRAMVLDFPSVNDGELRPFNQFGKGLSVDYSRHISNRLNLAVGVQYAGEVDRYHESTVLIRNGEFYSADLSARIKSFKTDRFFNADIQIGLGFYSPDLNDFKVQVPVGFNLYLKLISNLHIQIQPQYRWSPHKYDSDFQVGLGLIYLFGKNRDDVVKEDFAPDQDGDGIPDQRDDCPSLVGLQQFSGCPDSDSDGIRDIDDYCPKIPGLASNNGCPSITDIDSDGDGINNDIDECPQAVGLRKNNGCPDSDGDGVLDKNDPCPNDFGPTETEGCPDTDGDGVADNKDKCPSIAAMTNNGCPPIESIDRDYLDGIAGEMKFKTSSTILTAESKAILQKVKTIALKYPSQLLSVEGHTDSIGDEVSNQKLSEKRAKSCYAYLIEIGMSPAQLRFIGFGEKNPIESNMLEAGRTKNRRVEFRFL